MALATRVVTEMYTNPATGRAATGRITVTPIPAVWTDTAEGGIYPGGGEFALNAGVFSQALVVTDAAGVEPSTGRYWRYEERIDGLGTRVRVFALPLGDGTPVQVSKIVEADPESAVYVPVPGPQGEPGPKGDPGEQGAQGLPGPQPPLGGQGAGATTALRSTDILLAHKLADEPVTLSTVLQDDDHLAIAVAANATYALDSYLDVEADPAADITLGWSAPAGATLSWTDSGISAGNTGNIGSLKQGRNDLPATSGVGIVVAGSVVRPAGVLRTAGTAGTLRLRWAQTVSSATPTILKNGSWIRLIRSS
ncbi:collagen-like protein [Streptomyces sp. NPDC008121]|uniref:collagen-like triple helix repeat-containing protein n=1 Tax=Streptomyces sp. NPDC008121 TaxID=3364809 RepID=UPI0036E2654E